MIKLFRNIRQNLLAEGKTSKYFQYALGEIVLVVIGILIALQINNWNENRKERIQEVKYLENIKSDIAIEQINNDRMLELRLKKAEAASGMLFRKTPKGAQELEVFEESWRLVYFWQSYIPNNSVFKELSSSGHLNEITSDSLKFYPDPKDKISANRL